MEGERLGFAEGIALDTSGTLSEGSGENIFLVRDGVLLTPPSGSSILAGITRDTVLTLARDHGIPTREERIPREAPNPPAGGFFTGPPAGGTPVRPVDGPWAAPGRAAPCTPTFHAAFL